MMSEKRYVNVAPKPDSPTLSTIAPSKILPITPESINGLEHARLQDINTGLQTQEQQLGVTEEDALDDDRTHKGLSVDTTLSTWDLGAPPPRVSHSNAEDLAERLFSVDHLDLILKDPIFSQRFLNFLSRYRPQSVATVARHLESQKALAAIRYANSLADEMSSPNWSPPVKSGAAVIDPIFETFSQSAARELVGEALPAWITYQMVQLITEILVKEITGTNTPLMRELVQGLAEVYCMSDPSLPDHPIVFASEEFYNTTQYGQDYVIGKNCRFLQGPKTQPEAIKRISDAVHSGTEISEVILNYRRDGTPFINLVMMAPLMDHNKIRYFIGCQIDITNLIEGGRGLESMKNILDQDSRPHNPDLLGSGRQMAFLHDLGSFFNDEEAEVVRPWAREGRSSLGSGVFTQTRSIHNHTQMCSTRRFVGMDDTIEQSLWPPSHFGPPGGMPGVYQNYLLIRPYPSLRIIFTSAALRIPNLSQSRLMDRIGGPQHIREGLIDALAQGIAVTARIRWLTHSACRVQTSHPQPKGDQYTNSSTADTLAESEALEGKPRWIHCTPLLGSDGKPGVIMVIMVDKEEITGSLNAGSRVPSRGQSRAMRNRDEAMDALPMKALGGGGERYASAKMYAEYLRRTGQSGGESAEELKSGEVLIPDDIFSAAGVERPMSPAVIDGIVGQGPIGKDGMLSDTLGESQTGNLLNQVEERRS